MQYLLRSQEGAMMTLGSGAMMTVESGAIQAICTEFMFISRDSLEVKVAYMGDILSKLQWMEE
jgi:hypothetical protein